MAIHYAADYGQLEVIEYLVSKGADINVCNGNTYMIIIEYLVSKGADINVCNGNTYMIIIVVKVSAS